MSSITIKNGSRSEINGWVHIKVKGSPYERGYANGYLVAHELKEVFKMLDFSLMDTYGFSREFFAEVIGELYGTKIKEAFTSSKELENITNINQAARKMGINAVPFFEINNKTYISGLQNNENLTRAIKAQL